MTNEKGYWAGVNTSSESDQHNTPQHVIKDLATVFEWDLDVCASSANVCETYYTEEDDGLSCQWFGLVWCNPPYGRGIGRWLELAKMHGREYGACVMLLPARTDTGWWQNNVPEASQVVFVRGRFSFNDDNRAPFPSAFVVFGDISAEQSEKLNSYGWNPKQEYKPIPTTMSMVFGSNA